MRVLLLHHFPLAHSPVGWLAWHWATALAAGGDEVRLLVVDDERRFGEPVTVERVVCGDDPNADLTFPLPRFSADPDGQGRPLFSALSNLQLAQYRERLRRRLDAQVMHFDPHVIHVQHVWVLGQLALETGVPYLLNAWGPELADAAADERFRVLVEQGAENASRILAADASVQQAIASLFEAAADRTRLLPEALRLCESEVPPARQQEAGRLLHALYREVLEERFG
jgi:hypothetical protein